MSTRPTPKDRAFITRRRETHPDIWSGDITYKNASGSTSGFGCGNVNKEKALADLLGYVAYLDGLKCGHTFVSVTLSLFCGVCCEGFVKIPTSSRFVCKSVPCPFCKGNHIIQSENHTPQ